MSGRESVHSAVRLSAKPTVVAVPVHRVRDPRAKRSPEQSRFAEHLARRPRFPNGWWVVVGLPEPPPVPDDRVLVAKAAQPRQAS